MYIEGRGSEHQRAKCEIIGQELQTQRVPCSNSTRENLKDRVGQQECCLHKGVCSPEQLPELSYDLCQCACTQIHVLKSLKTDQSILYAKVETEGCFVS